MLRRLCLYLWAGGIALSCFAVGAGYGEAEVYAGMTDGSYWRALVVVTCFIGGPVEVWYVARWLSGRMGGAESA